LARGIDRVTSHSQSAPPHLVSSHRPFDGAGETDLAVVRRLYRGRGVCACKYPRCFDAHIEIRRIYFCYSTLAQATVCSQPSVLVPSPWSTRTSRFFSAARYPTLAINAYCSEPSSAYVARPRLVWEALRQSVSRRLYKPLCAVYQILLSIHALPLAPSFSPML
jgi:hypothetical protein